MDFRTALRRFDLETWVQKFQPKKYGNERAVTCPVCEKREKLWISLTKRLATCYYCSEGYGLFDLIMLLEDCGVKQAVEVVVANTKTISVGKDLPKAITKLVHRASLELAEEDQDPPVMEMPEHFVSYEEAYPKIPKYFRERGIDRKRAVKYGLGFCTAGREFNRLIVPIVFKGELRGYHPRWMKKNPPPGVKKVAYPPGMRSNLMLFNYDRAKRHDTIVLVEDPFSAMAVGDNAVAAFGTKLSPRQTRLLLNTGASRVVVMFDLDAIGKAHDLADRLATEGLQADVAEVSDARDPDELPPAEVADLVADAASSSLAARLRSKLA